MIIYLKNTSNETHRLISFQDIHSMYAEFHTSKIRYDKYAQYDTYTLYPIIGPNLFEDPWSYKTPPRTMEMMTQVY